MTKGTTTLSLNTFPFKVPVTVTVVAPAFSFISAGFTSRVIESLVVSSSVIRIPVTKDSLVPTLAFTLKARGGSSSLLLMGVTMIVVVPSFWPLGMVSACTSAE